MLEKQSVIDMVEVTRDGHVQVRRADLILENGIEIAKVYHRHVLSPGDDTKNENDRVKAIAQAVWTPTVVSAHRARVAALETEGEQI